MRLLPIALVAAMLQLIGSLTGLPSAVAWQDPAGAAAPSRVRIPDALVDAAVEPRMISPEGLVEPPSSPWTIGWYAQTGQPGAPGNMVMLGVADWRSVGPSVFYYLDELTAGDPIDVQAGDATLYRYAVSSVMTYGRDDPAALAAVFEETSEQVLTVFTDAEPFDPASQTYQNVLVVKGTPAGAPEPAPPLPPTTLYSQPGCPVDPVTLSLPTAATAPVPLPVQLTEATPADAPTLAAINGQFDQLLSCDVGALRAVRLSDGGIVALIGPRGAVPVQELANVLCYDWDTTCDAATNPVHNPTVANAYTYMQFVLEDGAWRYVPSPVA